MSADRTKRLERCYLCGEKVPRKVFHKFGHDILQCPGCSIYSLKFDGKYEDFIKEYYNEGFFTGSSQRIGYFDYDGDHLADNINMNHYLSRICRYKKTGKLLDVGCATGLFMTAASKAGFDAYGYDVSDYAVTKAKKSFGTRVKLGTVSKTKYKSRFFDLITMFDIVEHLQDPRSDLIKLKEFLKDDGVLVINTGDAGSLLARVQGKSWHFFAPPQHFFFFSLKTLTKLLDQAGFTVIKTEYRGKWLSLRYFFHLLRLIHYSRPADAFYRLISHSSIGKIPVYFLLFDNIIVYAKKNTC